MKNLKIYNPDLKPQVTIKTLISQVKTQKPQRTLGHVSLSRTYIREIKREVGTEEFGTLGPTTVYKVVVELIKQRKPDLLPRIKEEVGEERFKREVFNLYYREK
ncbi:hypothetical protein J7J18_07100 [bacterium]|nr:hypothetical protein [bacterium]